ncbi:alpha-rhamnosidase [Ascosphaera apis ARSEF 7405]|uniref:alpha-L-rhamnosidase n=1 Tax=Ascosphaera apis ARSEF 7405 TaxID=392613 RepID=A0A168AJU4_9EURO|nr:alpha-rhamnosidase [Ascosphaera apis ARSEF 7405]
MTLSFLRVGIHGFGEAIGIDSDSIRLYWSLKGSPPETKQTAYRVLISESRDALSSTSVSSSTEALVFDSGRINSSAQRNIPVQSPNAGAGFKSTTLHYYTVTVWDENDNASTSDVQEFYTGYPRCSGLLPPYSMNQTYMPHSSLIFRTWFEDEANRWKAVWIGDGGDKPIYIRKSIPLKKGEGKGDIERVFAFASGLGHFNLTVNGHRPQYDGKKHMIDPGWTNYHRTVQFVGYDLTPYWHRSAENENESNGENVIGAHIGNGFYAGDKGAEDRFFWPMYEDNTYVRYGNELCFFAEIHIHYKSGEHEVIISDPSWKVRKSATTLANIYNSEDCDLREYPNGWDQRGYVEDDKWASAKPVTGPRGRIRYQSQPPVVLHQLMPVQSVKEVRPGVAIYDLGQNASIHISLAFVGGEAGSEVVIRSSETISSQGELCMPDELFSKFQTGVYHRVKLRGTGTSEAPETWEPDFCFTSARYIQVENVCLPKSSTIANDLPIIYGLEVHHISSASRPLGHLQTDKEDINALINACQYTFSSNFFSYHTDCPQIEKFGWLEVTTLLFPATQYIRDAEALYAKILDDILDAQESSGLVPTMAPEMRYMAGPLHDTISWGCAIAVLPELIKKYYGWTGVITEKLFAGAMRYMEYMRTRERRGGLIEHGLGDWGVGIAFGNHQANLETAMYHRCLKACEMMAVELGKSKEEVKGLKKWAERVKEVYNRELLVTDKSQYGYAYYTSLDEPGARDRTMVAQAVAIQCDMVPASYRPDIIRAFIAAAEDSENVMKAGELGLRYLWATFAMPEVNRPDIVLAMCRQDEHPSYMRFLRRGETTLSEFWQDECRSKCHDMLGTIYEWMYAYVMGVTVVEDGWKVWRLRVPVKSEFNAVEGTVDCPYGTVGVRWKRDEDDSDNMIRGVVEVPTSTRCVIEVEGKEILARRDGAGEERGSDRVEIGAGEWELLVKR